MLEKLMECNVESMEYQNGKELNDDDDHAPFNLLWSVSVCRAPMISQLINQQKINWA